MGCLSDDLGGKGQEDNILKKEEKNIPNARQREKGSCLHHKSLSFHKHGIPDLGKLKVAFLE